jgi:hypothetical protein
MIYVLLFIFCIIIAIFFIKFSVKKPRVKKITSEYAIIDENRVERSDMEYYKDIKETFADRMKLYEPVYISKTDDDTIIEDNDVRFDNIYMFDADRHDEILDIPDEVFRNLDKQNVHDTLIGDNLKHKYDKSVYESILDDDTIINQISKYCNDDNVVEIVNNIKKRNSYLSRFDKTEWDILKNIWDQSKDDSHIRDQIIIEIKDCESSLGLHCPTGVSSRIVNALHIKNPENMPKDKTLLNQEIMNKFGKLMKTNSDKNNVKIQVIEEYRNLYDPDKIENIINEWIEYV